MLDSNLTLDVSTKTPVQVKIDVSNNVLLLGGIVAAGLIIWAKLK